MNLTTLKRILTLIICSLLFSCGKSEKEYYKNSRDAFEEMVAVSLLSEKINEYHYTIWRNAIYKEDTYYHEKYFGKDFNQALATAKVEMAESISANNKRVSKVDSLLKLLNDPPEKYEYIHKQILQMYGLTSEYASLAKSPKGSLTSYSGSLNNLSSEISKLTNEINVQLPRQPDAK